MTTLPRWWWISMAVWPITGIPLIAYIYIFFGQLPWPRPEDWSALTIAEIFAIYHPLILLPFALLQRAVWKRNSNA